MRVTTSLNGLDDPGRSASTLRNAWLDTIVGMLNKGAKGTLAEARAKIIYERLINLTADAGVKDALGFLMTREISHQKSFEKALYSIEPNFPPGKLPGLPRFADLYVNTSQGDGDMRGSWNSDENFEFVSDREQFLAMDGGDGLPSVGLSARERGAVEQMAARTRSNPDLNPETGANLGMPGGGQPARETQAQRRH